MAFLKQLILGIVVIAATLAIWVTYVPSAAGWLNSTGLPQLVGVELAEAAVQDSGGGSRGDILSLVVLRPVAARRR